MIAFNLVHWVQNNGGTRRVAADRAALLTYTFIPPPRLKQSHFVTKRSSIASALQPHDMDRLSVGSNAAAGDARQSRGCQRSGN